MLRCAHHGDLFMELGVPRAQPWPLIVEGRGPLKTGTLQNTGHLGSPMKLAWKFKWGHFGGWLTPKEVEL